VRRLSFFSLCLLLIAQQTGLGRVQSNEARPAKTNAAVQVCRDKISSVLGPTSLISPEGIHVAVPQKDVEAALARGYKRDMDALLKESQNYAKGDKLSAEHLILVKFSDEELTALYSDIFSCTNEQRDVLSPKDLVDYGIAMGEIASMKEYKFMGHLLVTNDEERVKAYNELASKYNELLARCPY
jgi:hypothetical protein